MPISTIGVHRFGRFNVRVVAPGEPLYHGLRRDFSREAVGSEREHTILEIFDSRYMAGFSVLGQFVSAYRACTLATFGGRSLMLAGDVPAWNMTEAETASLVALARSEATHC
jgi:hypothetical protein